jgi:hypothetical protein
MFQRNLLPLLEGRRVFNQKKEDQDRSHMRCVWNAGYYDTDIDIMIS